MPVAAAHGRQSPSDWRAERRVVVSYIHIHCPQPTTSTALQCSQCECQPVPPRAHGTHVLITAGKKDTEERTMCKQTVHCHCQWQRRGHVHVLFGATAPTQARTLGIAGACTALQNLHGIHERPVCDTRDEAAQAIESCPPLAVKILARSRRMRLRRVRSDQRSSSAATAAPVSTVQNSENSAQKLLPAVRS